MFHACRRVICHVCLRYGQGGAGTGREARKLCRREQRGRCAGSIVVIKRACLLEKSPPRHSSSHSVPLPHTHSQALNNADTLRLTAIFEVSCVTCGKSNVHDKSNVHRRRVARLIREDKKRRHKRRRDEDAMIAAFSRTGISAARRNASDGGSVTPSDVEEAMQDEMQQ